MPDPITVAALAFLGEQLASALQDLAKDKVGEMIADKLKDNPSERLKAARERDAREWQIQRLLALGDHLRVLQSGAAATNATLAKFEELLADPQFWRLQHNYQFEAGREAMDERRRMLAFASAGSFNVELTLGWIARVERSVRELDPEDIRLLADFGQQCAQGGGIKQGYAQHHSFEALAAAGCVRTSVAYSTLEPRDLSTLGRSVLKVMEGYLKARSNPDPHPPQR